MHRSLLPIVLFSFLAGTAALADDIYPRDGDHRPTLEGALTWVGTSAPLPLFIELGRPPMAEDTVRVAIRLDGDLIFTEKLRIQPLKPESSPDQAASSAGRPSVVEILAAHPNRRELLNQQAADRSVEVEINHNGASLGVFSWNQLEHRSQEMKMVKPADISSETSSRAVGVPFKSACEQLCEAELDDCNESRCGQFGSQSCYNSCNQAYEDCLVHDCGLCVQDSTTVTTLEVQSETATNTVLCTRSFFNSSVVGRQRLFNQRIKQTDTTTVTQTDCSQTLSTNVTYFNQGCWRWIDFNGCFPVVTTENPAANCS